MPLVIFNVNLCVLFACKCVFVCLQGHMIQFKQQPLIFSTLTRHCVEQYKSVCWLRGGVRAKILSRLPLLQICNKDNNVSVWLTVWRAVLVMQIAWATPTLINETYFKRVVMEGGVSGKSNRSWLFVGSFLDEQFKQRRLKANFTFLSLVFLDTEKASSPFTFWKWRDGTVLLGHLMVSLLCYPAEEEEEPGKRVRQRRSALEWVRGKIRHINWAFIVNLMACCHVRVPYEWRGGTTV